jgi:hypothetical protein
MTSTKPAALLRSLGRRLPEGIREPLTRACGRIAGVLQLPPAPERGAAPADGEGPVFAGAVSDNPKNPFGLVSEETLRYLDECFRGYHRNELLQIRLVRQVLARERVKNLMAQGAPKRVLDGGEFVAFNTIEYNIEGAISAADLDRPSMMFDVVKAIERVARQIDKLDALSIGPRSEIEIFGMMAAGFNPDRIKAIDLFSYSPYVEVGDMHCLPYAENSFDVIFLGWVLSYSRDQSVVVRELIRVARDRAVIVLAGDYSDSSRDRPTFKNEVTHMQSCDQLLTLFGDAVRKVYFRHDPELPDIAMVLTVFELGKARSPGKQGWPMS